MVLPTYKSLEEKKKFFHYENPEQINTIKEFRSAMKKYEEEKYFLFRGVNEAKYKLYTSAQREWMTQEWDRQGCSFVEFVDGLLSRIKDHNVLMAYHKSLKVYNNDLLYLSFLQHYGAPAPLIDFTYDIRVALFFALDNLVFNKKGSEDIDNYFSLYRINRREINGLREHYENANRIRDKEIEAKKQSPTTDSEATLSLFNRVFKWYDPEGYGLCNLQKSGLFFLLIPNPYYSFYMEEVPNANLFWSNPNIIAQRGCFLLNPDQEMSFDEVLEAFTLNFLNEYNLTGTEEEKYHRSYLRVDCLDIHKSLAHYIREEYLKSEGITTETIYPDFNAIANEAYEAFKRNPTAKISLADLPDSKD